MVKKVVVGALVIGLSAVLILGAVRRTQDKTSTESERDQGRGQSAEGVQNEDGERARNGQQGADGERVDPGAAGETGGLGESTAGNWITRQGAVETCDESMLMIAAADGEAWEIGGRAWAYAQEQGFAAQSGDQLVVVGFYEDDEFKPAQVENRTSGQRVTLRDDAGRPMWSGGRGRRST